ncbi:substrate-binding periplasmic protein [Thalassotalea atypica]|uniref:substrate-binding periplasmic protein n=1 Tax=Thalassotalea atypica TaxID=2054316 RepID=UPI002572B573|nr:transporter substrate-binding domain-containing protein [Thalassotalea atypica]
MFQPIFIYVVGFVIVVSFNVFANDKKAAVNFYTEAYPPANYVEEGELKGITVDTLKAMWQHLGEKEQPISIVPWARGYRYALDVDRSALFTMSKIPARERMFKWVGPIFYSTHVLFAKKKRKLKINSLGQVFDYDIAAVRGDISEVALLQLGFPSSNLSAVLKLEQAFLMLETDRVDMIVLTIHGYYHLASLIGFDTKEYEQVWQVNKVGNYIAFHKNTPDSLILKYQTAFEAIAKQRIAIKQKYDLPLDEY